MGEDVDIACLLAILFQLFSLPVFIMLLKVYYLNIHTAATQEVKKCIPEVQRLL